MATQTTGGGSTTSFTNTPQAKDDNYLFLEDALRNNASLYSETTKIITLDVMSNDLGGNAKTLFSVEDGDGNAITADFDLLCKDVNAAGVSEWECTFGGNWVRINNGKIEYVIADGSGVKGQGRSVDSLTDGEAFSDQFVYAIRLGNGTLSEATVKINITGKQDAASIAVSGASDNCVVEAGGTANGVAGDPNACGTLSVTDKDSGENKFKPVTGSLDGNYGTFTFDENSGKWTYTLDNIRPATEALAEGDSKTESLTVYSFDGSDSYVIQVTVKGTNDAPVAVADSGTTSENAALLVNVLANDTDADDGHVLTVTSASAPAGQGSASVVGNQVQFDPGTDFDHLAVGDSAIVTVSYSIKDEHGATASSTVQITVTGTNDDPVAVADTDSATEGGSAVTGSVATNDSDPDDGASLSYALVAPVAGLTLNPDGSYSFDPTNAAYNHLAQGATTDVVASYTVSDGLGGSDTATLTITVTGTNDDPVAVADTDSATEGGSAVTGSVATNDSDPDDGASLSYALVAPVAGLTLNPDGSYSFDPTNAAYNHLAQGATTDVVASYTVSDGLGGSDTATLTITVTGTNDDPVAVADTDSATEGGSAVTGSVATNDSDPDDGASLSYALVAPVAGLTLNPDGSYSFDPTNAAYNHLAQGATTDVVASYTVSDGLGGSDTATLTITVTGTNDDPVAVADTDSATEGGSAVTGSVATNDSDPDDGASLSYALVAPVAGLTLNPDGSYSFDPTNAAYNHLAQGATTDVVASYTVSDGLGGSDTATLTITVTGTNDDPVAADDTGAGNEDTLISGNVGTNDTDADDGHSLSYSLVGSAPAGFTLNPNGSWSLDASNSAYQHLATGATAVVTVGYTVSDGLGGSDTGELKITVTGVNDNPALTAAQASLAAGTEDQNYIVSKVSLLQGFTDVDDGTVLNVSGLSANHGTVVNNGDGTFTIQPELNYNGPVTLSYSVIDGQGGSVPATLQFNLAAVNDPAVITGTSSGTVVEDAVPNTVGGNLNSTDVDGVNDSWTVVSSQTASANGYGTFTIDAAGNWVYSLNNGNGTVNALNNLQSLSDSFTVTTADGTTKVVNITINGHTDFTYTPPPLSNALDVNDHDDDHSGSVAGSLVIMAPGSGPNGTDVLEGSNGADTIYAGNSPDQVYGHNGGDHIYGENGADVSLYGQRGDDFIYGGNSDDTIYGGSGNDTIFGNSDPNSGGASNDTIYGGSGRDTIDGQDGNDVINGGNGQDLLTGGDGNDIFVYQKATDTGDFIFDFQQGSDKIDLTAFNFDAADFVGAIAGAGQVGAGQFGYMTYNNGTTTVTTIYVDTDGVFGADMEITIVAPVTLTGSDFLI
jgi:VCBS repeat-containing protein